MRALVTGSGGFVGHHLVEHLASCGDDVTSTDRAHGGPDITDTPALAAVISASGAEVVYHLAGQADVAASWQDPTGTFRANGEGTVAVLAAAAEAGVGRVLVVSSAEVYGIVGPERMPITEAMPLDPASPYAASKAAAEMAAIQWSKRGLDVIRARAFNHLGPGQSERFVAPALAGRLVRAAAAGDPSISVGNLDARRDFTDVRDVVRAYRLLATDGVSGQAYNVCSGVDHAVAEIAAMLLERTDPSIELLPDPDLQRPSDLPILRGDNTSIRDATGWAPEIPLATTLDDVIEAATDALTTAP
ncbi:MAG: GDP-mannose 4,6-dehydratase [Actinomycetota bacterium]